MCVFISRTKNLLVLWVLKEKKKAMRGGLTNGSRTKENLTDAEKLKVRVILCEPLLELFNSIQMGEIFY